MCTIHHGKSRFGEVLRTNGTILDCFSTNMIVSWKKAHLFLLLLLFWGQHVGRVEPIWTQFDLVRSSSWRNRDTLYGSDGNTSYTRISSTEGNGPSDLPEDAAFGASVVDIGDLDGDGVHDLVVGAPLLVTNCFIIPYHVIHALHQTTTHIYITTNTHLRLNSQ